MRELRVKVADYAVAKGDSIIVTMGLGSCVAIALYDVQNRVGALAHILLPSGALSRDQTNPAKFPATAVPLLLQEMRQLGGRGPVVAKIAGGASMFGRLLSSDGVNMGERNVEAACVALRVSGVPLLAHDTGGDYGRSVALDVGTGSLTVRSLRRGSHVL